ncbi:hypothetical protein J2W21_003012 [Sinomonas atrocyanea]|uniref:P-loop NTPase fold protein n=1 Tax=Sinomonas atrocyanea TaxID=37927 RepID=UPI002789B58A|nr:P-loop NTPase fold protein [Sinomonas atrocyanea]MDP9885489.1 hypothetical protein [Sinomonas atrocyanea]
MFERFTGRARRVVAVAQDEASTLNHSYIGTEHLLLGLLSSGEGVAFKALDSEGVSIDEIRSEVVDLVGLGEREPTTGHIPFSPRAKKTLELSLREALALGHNYIGTEHMLLGLLSEGEGRAIKVLRKVGTDLDVLRERVLELLALFNDGDSLYGENGGSQNEGPPSGLIMLEKFGTNLTRAAWENKLDPTIGRDDEMERVMRVLSLRTRNIPLLVGEPGVGKNAVIEGLAQSIVRGDAPGQLKKRHLYVVDLGELGAVSSDSIYQNLNTILKEAGSAGVVLYIDELHLILKDGPTAETRELVSTITSFLKSGDLSLIGGTGPEEYESILRKNQVMQRVLEPISVEEMSEDVAVEYLKSKRDDLETFHRVTITDDALYSAVKLAHRFLRQRRLPESAFSLVDSAGAETRSARATPLPIREIQDKINLVRIEKEAAIDNQDFESAASIRDRESKLMLELESLKRRWREGEFEEIIEISVREVVRAAAQASGAMEGALAGALADGREDTRLPHGNALALSNSFVLLGDRPVSDPKDDLLDSAESAKALASVLDRSRSSSPLVIAVDGGWGLGKSTVLRLIESAISPDEDTHIVRFNAWTAVGDNALESLIKSVLLQLDPNFLRRWTAKLAKQRHVVGLVRVLSMMLFRFIGGARLIDELWKQLDFDPKHRDQLRISITEILTEWSSKPSAHGRAKTLLVFIDDLDRCSNEAIVNVCEAVKLYLDSPGLVFVIGCDLSVVAQGVSSSDRGGDARVYLEKIVQVVYRLRPISRVQVQALIRGYAEQSQTSEIIDDNVAAVLVDRTGRNPRRIKRLINSFILETQFNSTWGQLTGGYHQLMVAVILQNLYPPFYEWLLTVESEEDPIGSFLDYAEVKVRALDLPLANDAWWSLSSKLFRRHGVAPPTRSPEEGDAFSTSLARLEKRLPDYFPRLVGDPAFLALLRGLGEERSRVDFCRLLSEEPLASESVVDAIGEEAGGELTGSDQL